jgi:hypothetical protein
VLATATATDLATFLSFSTWGLWSLTDRLGSLDAGVQARRSIVAAVSRISANSPFTGERGLLKQRSDPLFGLRVVALAPAGVVEGTLETSMTISVGCRLSVIAIAPSSPR